MRTLITWLVLALCSARWWGKKEDNKPIPITRNKRSDVPYQSSDSSEGINCNYPCPSCVRGACYYENNHEFTGQNFHRCSYCTAEWIVRPGGQIEYV